MSTNTITLELDILDPQMGSVITNAGGSVRITAVEKSYRDGDVVFCRVSGTPWAVLAWLVADYTNMDTSPMDAALDLLAVSGTQGQWYPGARVSG